MNAISNYLADTGSSLKSPFGTSMSWTQLAAVVVFVLVVMFAWRQVVLFIAEAA